MPNPSLQVVRNFLSLSGAEVLGKLFTLAAFAYVARLAGPIGFGHLELAAAVVLCAGLLVDQGFGSYGAREIARDPAATPRLVAEVTTLRFLLAGGVYAGLVVLVWLVDRPADVERLVLIFGLTLFFMPLMLQWVFQGHDRMNEVASMQIARQGVFALLIFALLRAPARLELVAIAEVVGAACVVALSLGLYKRRFGRSARPGTTLSGRLLREGSTIGLGQIFWSLRIFGATVVVGAIATAEDVGFFGAAMRITVGLYAFVWLYFFNLLPSLSRTWIEASGAFQRLIGLSLRATGWLTLGAGMLWVLLAPAATRLVYGDAFTPAAVTLQWLSGVCVLGALHGHFRFGLIAAGQERYATLAIGIGTVVTLGSIVPGYRHLGVAGAAMALVAGEAAVACAAYLFSVSRLKLERPLRQLYRPTLLGVPLVATVFWLLPEGTPLWPRLALAAGGLGIVAYVSDGELRATSQRQVAEWLGRGA